MTTENRLLNVLPQALYEKLTPALKKVSLPRGTRLHDPGETIYDLYFPLNCVLSITITMSDGTTAETGLVGNREVLGVNAFMGAEKPRKPPILCKFQATPSRSMLKSC